MKNTIISITLVLILITLILIINSDCKCPSSIGYYFSSLIKNYYRHDDVIKKNHKITRFEDLHRCDESQISIIVFGTISQDDNGLCIYKKPLSNNEDNPT